MAAGLHHFLLLAPLLLLHGTSSARPTGDVVAAENGKVRVEVYYESLCPDSVGFLMNQLAPAFKEGLLVGAAVTLVPYGNAKVAANGTISCQVLCHRLAARPIRSSALHFSPSSFGYSIADVFFLQISIADVVNS
jgi:hypothetical protein